MACAVHRLRVAGNSFAVALLLFAMPVLLGQVHGGLRVDPEDINKTIKSENGVVIDCVYIHKQPTLKHPMFKDHKIQVYKYNSRHRPGPHDDGDMAPPPPLEQEWHRSGSCPAGTVPIRRMPETSVQPNITVVMPALSTTTTGRRDTIVTDGGSNSPTDEFAVAVALDWPYLGASALLPLWRPTKIEPHDTSITSIAVAGRVDRYWKGRPGQFPPDTTNLIAIGFMASSSFYGNDNPNLYVYYSNDGGKRKCFNLQCPGFVQTRNKIAFGTSFINGGSSITYDGVPYVTMSIHKAPGQQPWWVTVNETAIGYFPHTLFPIFFPESFVNQVGGVVHNSRPKGVHTDTVMGNGRAPDSGSSAVVKAYLAIGPNGVDKVDRPDKVGVTAPKCYNAAILGENVHIPGFDIAYGGPGGSGCDQ